MKDFVTLEKCTGLVVDFNVDMSCNIKTSYGHVNKINIFGDFNFCQI